jgi:aspartate carbamoyltransferase catalytic subunit
MTITEQFRDEIEIFLSATGMDPTRFGRAVMNDPNFVFDLREKRSPTAATMDKVRSWMSAHLENDDAAANTGTGSLRPSQQHLLGIEDLSPDEITAYLDLSDTYVEQNRRADKKSAVLRGRTIINLFFETSTRTSTSFELAGKRLGGDVINMSVATSAVKKGETLIDTAMTLTAMHPDVLVVRHPESGSVKLLSEKVNCAVINAGDGSHEHPTQALLDALTIRRRLGRLNNLTVAICGDVLHSRVARSNIYLLQAMGARVRVVAPPTLLPAEIERFGVDVFTDMAAGLKDCDIVMMLRLQTERMQGSYVPSTREYFRYYGLDREKLSVAHPDALVMHPGPMNRGIEIDSALADDIDRSLIREQVEMGVAVRMACLDLLTRSQQGDNAK